MALVGDFIPEFGDNHSYSSFVRELRRTSLRGREGYRLEDCELGRVNKWWTFGRQVESVPYMASIRRGESLTIFDPQLAVAQRNYSSSRDAMYYFEGDVCEALDYLMSHQNDDLVKAAGEVGERFNLKAELHLRDLENEGRTWSTNLDSLDVSNPDNSDNFFVDRKVRMFVMRNLLEDYLVMAKFFNKLRFRPELESFVLYLLKGGKFGVTVINGREFYNDAKQVREERRRMEFEFWNSRLSEVKNDPRRRLYPTSLEEHLTMLLPSRITCEEDKRICFLLDFLF